MKKGRPASEKTIILNKVRELLMYNSGLKFTVKGKTFMNDLIVFSTGSIDSKTGNVQSINSEYMGGMNVSKFGPTCVTLYTYDMLGNKTVGKIKYADVALVED